MRPRPQHGFSFLELVIVVAMALVIAGFAVPAFMQTLRNYRISGAVRDINAEIRLAKMRAGANFTWTRVRFDPDARQFISQIWCRTADPPCSAGTIDTWIDSNVGGPQVLPAGVTFGVGPMTAPPPDTQAALAMAPFCTEAPLDATLEDGESMCIAFNSRGYPVLEATGASTPDGAMYITDGGQTHGVTVSITGITRQWRGDASDPTAWIRR